MDNKINSLIKQNEAIYNSLKVKNTVNLDKLVELSDIMTLEQKLEALTLDNNRLKELSKQNKPPQTIKVTNQQTQPIEDDDCFTDPINQFECITNMEDMKRAFFGCENNDLTQFNEIAYAYNFKLYIVNYKYSSDKDGAPTFSAKNLVGGFIRNFDDLRKYFMICFRCFSHNDGTYTYPSYWIVNSNEPLQNIIGTIYDDFEFTECHDKEVFYKYMHKMNPEEENLVTERYVH